MTCSVLVFEERIAFSELLATMSAYFKLEERDREDPPLVS